MARRDREGATERAHQRDESETQENRRQSQTDHGAHQPTQVVAGRTQHRVQRIAQWPRQMATIHAVIGLQMTDPGFDRLSAFQPAALCFGERLGLAAMDDLDAGVVGIDAPVAQIDDHFFGTAADVFEQDGRLLQLFAQGVPMLAQSRNVPFVQSRSVPFWNWGRTKWKGCWR